jgi:hypothetical protein
VRLFSLSAPCVAFFKDNSPAAGMPLIYPAAREIGNK